MEEKKFTCTVCPRGCPLSARKEGEEVTVTGASCQRGMAYGREEMIDPRRMLTTTVRVKEGLSSLKLLPVRTATPLPKRLMLRTMELLRGVEVTRKVNIGDIICENILDSGVDIIAAADL